MCEFSNAVKTIPLNCIPLMNYMKVLEHKTSTSHFIYSVTSSVHPLVYITVLNIRYSHPSMCTAQEIVDPRSANSPK